MKVLITGGAGFIGSHVVDAFLAKGDEVVILDHCKKEKLRFIPEGVHVVQEELGSVAAQTFLASYQPDTVCHLAAQISVTRSIEEPAYDAQINTVDALAFLQTCAKVGVKTFIFAGSGGAMYGKSKDIPATEDTIPMPESPYGISKMNFENYLWYIHDMYGMRTVSLRLGNVYGPRQQYFTKDAAAIPIFLHNMFTGVQTKLFGDGTATRDYTYVTDFADAFVKAAYSSYQGFVNIASGIEISMNEVWELLSAIHGAPTDMVHVESRKGEVVRSCLSPARAKQAFGWEPTVTFAEGLKKTHDWYKQYCI